MAWPEAANNVERVSATARRACTDALERDLPQGNCTRARERLLVCAKATKIAVAERARVPADFLQRYEEARERLDDLIQGNAALLRETGKAVGQRCRRPRRGHRAAASSLLEF